MKKKDALFEEFEPSRRDFVRKAVAAGFTAPVIATFAMTGLMSRSVFGSENQDRS